VESPTEKPDWHESDEEFWTEAKRGQDARRGLFWVALIVLGYALLHNLFQHVWPILPA
jgi:hypothetical protein